ncbi:hypothetical protein RS86_03962 [Microbacterium azadirachtae]|uniref:Uncharacterized protein n=1 Tax=Microbacterium azadirachtae TaxID=582680 RepID=A0A0F0LHI8_9MICO|nr:hypothetical protein RS86_03962 [Microbacterium azadirachtae]
MSCWASWSASAASVATRRAVLRACSRVSSAGSSEGTSTRRRSASARRVRASAPIQPRWPSIRPRATPSCRSASSSACCTALTVGSGCSARYRAAAIAASSAVFAARRRVSSPNGSVRLPAGARALSARCSSAAAAATAGASGAIGRAARSPRESATTSASVDSARSASISKSSTASSSDDARRVASVAVSSASTASWLRPASRRRSNTSAPWFANTTSWAASSALLATRCMAVSE